MSRSAVPSHWMPYNSDSGWYSLSHPPTWQVERRDQWFILRVPDNQGKLSFNCLRLAPRPDALPPPELDLASLLPSAAGLARAVPLDIPWEHVGLEGPADRFEGLFGKPDADDWQWAQIWLMRHEGLLLSVLFCQAGERDPELQTVVRMVLGSVRLAATPADPADVFTERVVAEARRRYPARAVEATDVLSVRFGDAQVGLTNFYRQYIATPDRFSELAAQVLERAEQLQGAALQRFDPTLDAVRERIMPMLYPHGQWQENFPNHVGEPWVGPLAILYVVDQPDTYWYVRDDLLEKWGISQRELHDLALSNLSAYWDVSPMELHVAAGEHGPSMVLPAKRDAYNAVRFLCPQFRDELLELFGRPFVIGLPNRDFFVATAAESRELLQHCQQQVRSDYTTADHPLCDRLLWVGEDGVTEYPG
jgi:hypothetical protein